MMLDRFIGWLTFRARVVDFQRISPPAIAPVLRHCFAIGFMRGQRRHVGWGVSPTESASQLVRKSGDSGDCRDTSLPGTFAPHTDGMRRTLWSVIILCVVTIPVACLLAWLPPHSHEAGEGAARAAVEQFETRSGSTGATAEMVYGWQDCAIISLRDGPHVAMRKVGAQWITGRTTEDGSASFDEDDISSREECLTLADSTGPIVNGGPE